jgi:hypothetical protein
LSALLSKARFTPERDALGTNRYGHLVFAEQDLAVAREGFNLARNLGASIDSVSGGPEIDGPITYVTPLLHPNMKPPASVMPGILHAPGMYSNPLRLVVE